MANKKIYDVSKVLVVIGPVSSSFALDSNGPGKVSAKRNKPKFSTFVSANGDARNVKSNDNTGTVTITIPRSSNVNELIMALDKTGVQFPIFIADKTSNKAIVAADGCLLTEVPEWIREADDGDVEYVFTATSLEMWHAGAADE